MKKFKKIFFLLVFGSFILSLLSSCHKYPEDPFISFKKPIKRLTSGSWKIISYKIDGKDHAHDFDNLLNSTTITDCKIKFSENDYHIEDSHGNWVFHSSMDRAFLFSRTLQIIAFDTLFNEKFWKISPVSPPAIANNIEWTVEELYGKKMHLRLGNTDIYFKKE